MHGNPQKFSGPLGTIDGYGRQVVEVGKVVLTLKIGILSQENMRFLSLQYQRTYGALVSYKVKLCTPLSVSSASRLE